MTVVTRREFTGFRIGAFHDCRDAQQYEVKSVSSPEPLATTKQVSGDTQHWSPQ
jgi:hypothetical protein